MSEQKLSADLIKRSWELAKSKLGSRLPGAEALDRAPFAEYVNDPVGFIREILDEEPWEKQREIAEVLRDFQRVAVATCNGAGKSTLAAWLILWFVCTRKNARVVTTAGVGAQVLLLWRKIRASHAKARKKLPGKPKTVSWNINPEWYAIGFSTDEEEKLQGYHSYGDGPPGSDGGLLAVIDEASGVGDFVFNAMRGYFTTRNCYWLILGNPNNPQGEFFESFRRGKWKRFQISAFDCPEFMISRDWIDEQELYWGVDSPQYQVRVLGQFPSVGGDYLVFPLSYFEGSADIHPTTGGRHMGVDIARGDHDRNTIVLTDNDRVIEALGFHSNDLMRTALRVAEFAEAHDVAWNNVHIDVIGIGAGVVDRMREAGYSVDGVDFGTKPYGDWDWLIGRDASVLNRRAELYWAARTMLAQGKASVPREFKASVWKECGLVQYEMTPQGVTKIEAKEKVRARFEGQSPDFADAWVLSFSRARRNFLPMLI